MDKKNTRTHNVYTSLLMGTIMCLMSFSAGYTQVMKNKGLQSITAREIKAHVFFLASELLEGRGNGERGLEIAADYIAAQFEDAGLEPIGDDSSFFQKIELTYSLLGKPNILEIIGTNQAQDDISTYKIGKDFLPFGFSADKEAKAQVVFAGYGITAPEYDYDDYKDIDVEGKIVLLLRHEPKENDKDSIFKGADGQKHSRFLEKALNAKNHGAVGMLMVTDPLNHTTFEVGPVDSTKKLGFALKKDNPRDPQIPAVHITLEVAQKLFMGSGKDLLTIQRNIDDNLKPESFALNGRTVYLKTVLSKNSLIVRNVAGMVKGNSDEYIIIGGHYDHEGLKGNEILYGADDNASGTASLIELSEAFMLNEERPQRNIIFLAFAAEEGGLLGSEYYTEHPLRPLNKTIAMFQLDMIGRNEDTESMNPNRRKGFPIVNALDSKNKIHLIGTTYSQDMKLIAERNIKDSGLELFFEYDNIQNLVKRSDHWNFLKKGIPAVLYIGGLHPDYHTSRDTADKIEVEKMQRILRLVYSTVWDLADDTEKPVYKAPL